VSKVRTDPFFLLFSLFSFFLVRECSRMRGWDDHPRPMQIFKSVRYCVVNVLSPPNLVPAMLVALIRK
jgi:hypothetical protein